MKRKRRTVLITGADGGIGKAILEALIAAEYNVIALVRSEQGIRTIDSVLPTHKANVAVLQADLGREEEYQVIKEYVRNYSESIYGLVNNAGVYPIIPFEKYDMATWDHTLDINLTAVFRLSQIIWPFMKKEGGRIINISSTGAHLGSRDVAYSASKAGLIGLTKSLARNLAKDNILVNAITPGTIASKMSNRMKKRDVKANAEKSLLKRIGSASEVTPAVLFLLDIENSYMTGTTLDINGGMYIR